MLRKLNFSILFLCAIFTGDVVSAFAQTKPPDKTTLARFEKSVEAGKIEQIERPLLDFAVANPNNREVLELLAKVRVRQNRLSEAAALYRRVLTLDADSASAKINLARILHATGKADEAKRMLGDISENAVANDALRLNLATTFLNIGEPQKALEAAEKLSPKTKNAAALPVLAASFAAIKNTPKLRELLPLMKRAAASDSSVALQCAEALQKAGMISEAADLLRAALTAAPNDFDVLIDLAKFEIAARDKIAARKYLAQAAELQPRSVKLYLAQTLFEEAQSEFKAAFEAIKQARALAPAAPEVLSQFVITAMRAEQTRAAIEAARILAQSKPDEPEYLYLLGVAALTANDVKTAELNLRRLMELRPTDSRGCLMLGLTLAAQPAQIETARRQLVHCIEFDANNFEAKYQLGLSYKTQGENQKAVEYFEETIKTSPNYADALRDLGASYLQTGAEAKARVALEKAVALAPTDADTHFQLSRLYNLTGETALARKHLETFQKLRSAAVK